ncbi:putative ABC transport system ATP-binding protein [Desulfacinum infernum DSM 9756]|uniref:Putative ABC transport system ATP-binding protein n=1 Tax=Desulfacinum infernum DSM 9756 TaxID=1121391 RepID=A0A1M5G8A9_9BACT|nr:ABC transporter ATP-binding protein [Desulfacinum infernum]SHF99983.1 putative ABC transport system ATP-binding protein [Desulfacinum infernum DSM 9756]
MTSRPSPASKPLIVARDLSRIYHAGKTRVVGLDHVDLEVGAGEMVVLKGVSGSGKSTLLALLAGLDRPTSGMLHVAGLDLLKASSTALTHFRRRKVGMVFQSFNLLPTLTVLENVCLPGLLAGDSESEVRRRARAWIERMGLGSRMHHLPGELSGGEMQRTAIARALINDPPILLADEPTGNLDSDNGGIVVRLLADLNRSHGRTVVMATHGDLADAFATRIVRLRDGRMV